MQPMRHQIKARDIGRSRPRFGYFFDCGTGKTISLLLLCADRPMRTLVACPKSIIDDAWLKDAKHFPSLKIVSGRAATTAKRRKIIAGQWDVLVLNYELVVKHVEDLLAVGVRRAVFDESSGLKNYRSQRTKACLDLASRVDECYCLSGTPAPNGEHEYWAQLRCIHPSKVPLNYWRFCNSYMTPIRRTFGGKEVTAGWRLIESRRAAFESLLAECSWSLKKEECVDLPPRVDEFRNVELSLDEMEAYVSLRTQLLAEHNGERYDFGVQSRLMKLRQLTGGWVYVGEREPLHFGESKLNELSETLEEIGYRPVVIWSEFTHDLDRIAERLHPHARIIDGRTSDENRREYLDGFGERFQYLVCHPKAVGHGITLTQASYAIYYSVGYSYETYHQSKDRIHRIGQKMPCTYIHLVAADTCDKRIIEVLQRKGSDRDAMMAALSEGSMRRTDGQTENIEPALRA